MTTVLVTTDGVRRYAWEAAASPTLTHRIGIKAPGVCHGESVRQAFDCDGS